MNWQNTMYELLVETKERDSNAVRRDISAMLSQQSHSPEDQSRLRNLQRELRVVSSGRNEMQQALDASQERRKTASRRKGASKARSRGRRSTDLP